MKQGNKELWIIALVAVVNALGYGIIIPILYSYSRRFGLSDFENGLLFSLFSLCQFVSTPLIGRLSDKYGRRPLLLVSLGGTFLSFLLMAFAPSAIFIFLARALDGITAGNIPVVSAVISDTTTKENRAKGFGIIGASFGFGFVFGPAISALTVGLGVAVPFLVAALVSLVAIVLTFLMLPETNQHMGEVSHAKLFDFHKMARAVFDKDVGVTLILSFVYSFAFALFIYAYQPFAVKMLGLTSAQIAINFTAFGAIGVITQVLIIPRVVKFVGEKKALTASLVWTGIYFALFGWVGSEWGFVLVGILFGLGNSFVSPLIQTLLSREADEKSQGSIMGLNSSYVSMGTIFGPIAGGVMATISLRAPFMVGAMVVAIAVWLSIKILRKPHLVRAF